MIAGSVPLAIRIDGSAVPAPRVRAAQLVFSPQGRQVARYDKLHLFDVDVGDAHGRYTESAQFEPGDAVVLADINGISTGLMICYDLRFPRLAQRLRERGAELLIYPVRSPRPPAVPTGNYYCVPVRWKTVAMCLA